MKFEKGRVFDVAHMIDYAEGGDDRRPVFGLRIGG